MWSVMETPPTIPLSNILYFALPCLLKCVCFYSVREEELYQEWFATQFERKERLKKKVSNFQIQTLTVSQPIIGIYNLINNFYTLSDSSKKWEKIYETTTTNVKKKASHSSIQNTSSIYVHIKFWLLNKAEWKYTISILE